MLATLGDMPEDLNQWALELKWDGVRALSYLSGDGVKVCGRRGSDVTSRYPELAALADLIPAQEAILDGEIVAFADGKPSFERLQRRMHVARPDPQLIRSVPIRYVVFDLLALDGRSLCDLPYRERRALLQELDIAAGPIEVPPYLPADDAEQVVELLAYTKEEQLEGLVAKRLDSRYQPGRRVTTWRKIKNVLAQEVVICGWRSGQGRRLGSVGSLLVGVYDAGELTFAGHVGTGFSDAALDEMSALLAPLAQDASPCAGTIPREIAKDAHWVRPVHVGEVAFAEWTKDGRLRHPSWRGLRPDKEPEDAVRES
ncbi:MAG: non-homologous end-joining DNA ligase [Streptosporangiaceae bacterium]